MTVGAPAASSPFERFGKWLASERVFKLIPFVLVEGLFILVILIPFLLTIYISLLKWRANRPFETARFSGLENYEDVLTQRSVLAGGRPDLLLRRRRRRRRASGRLRPGHAGHPVHALEEALHHDLPDADDDRADRRRLQLLDDLHRQRAAQSAAGAGARALRHRSAHPLAVRSGRRAVGHHHRRHLAVDLAHLPDLPVRVLGAPPAARQRGARHGRHAVADLLARRSSRCSSRPSSSPSSSARWKP